MNGRIRFQIIFPFIVLLFISPCFPQTRQTPQRQGSPRPSAPFLQQVKSYEETAYVTKVVLKNGMTVLVNEFQAQPVVSIQVYVRAGFFADPPQSCGTARMVAAIIQRGTGDKSSGTLRQQVHAFGGVLRSKTDYATTSFEIVAPSSQWRKALDVQAEAILNPSFTQEGIRLESGIIRSEASGILDDAREFGNEKLLELAFNQPRMGKYGTLSGTLGAFTPEGLAAYYKAQFTPARMMLVVSGDVAAGEILNEVVKVFMKPPSSAERLAPPSVSGSQNGLRYRSIRGNVPVPHLFLGFHAAAENDEDFAALEILRSALGIGNGSVIQARLRDQKKLILSGDATLAVQADFGYLTIQMNVNPSNIDKSEIALLTELELFKREELTDAEMERAVAQLERSYWESLETASGKAQALFHFESLGDWKRWDRYASNLRKIKAADVKRVASKYLRLEKCSLLEYLPSSSEDRQLTSEAIRRTFSELLGPSADQEQAERNKETVLALKIPPNAGSFKFSGIRYPFQVASILRGPELFIREDHTNPLIEMGFFFPGGKLDEKKNNSGITKMLLRMILRGGADAMRSHQQLEIYGGKARPVVRDDYFGFCFSIPSQNVEEGLRLLLDAVQSPNFDNEEVERQKEIQSAEILCRSNSGSHPVDLVNRALFGDFSYALPPDGTPESMAAITPEALKSWYEAHVKNRKPIIVTIGDSKGTSLASMFVQKFSGSRIQQRKITEEFVKPMDKGVSEDRSWNRSESLILVGFQAPPEDDEDGHAVAVLQSYADDPGRFSQELRDRLGAAYNISVEYHPRLRGGSFIIRAATIPGCEEQVLKALREEMQRIYSGPITYREFSSAMNEAAGAYAVKQQARFEQIEEITKNVLAGKGLEGYKNQPVGLQEVNDEDLKAVAQRIFDLDKAVILRVRGKQ
jgi:zinc protease